MFLQQLTDPAELDLALETPDPILIFKHSPTCGISAQANDEILDLLSGPPLPARVWQIPVPAGRAASNAVATRFGIRHESPQVLLISRGELLWHASHHRVNGQEIRSALARHLP